MIKILFVCHGNICRSPIGEFVKKDLVSKNGLSEAFHIESSATHTDEIWNGVGSPIYPPAKEKLRENGIGTSDNELGVGAKRARLTRRDDYDRFDFIIGMDSANIRNLRNLFGGDPEGKVHKMLEYTDRGGDVADPWYTGNFDATWKDVSEGCHGLFRAILTDRRFAEDLRGCVGDDDFYGNEDPGRTYDDFPRG